MIVARTDADAADMLISDADERDHEFLTGERTAEGFFRTNAGIEQAIARGIAYAPYADLVWCETSEPDMEQAERFARELHEAHPGKLLAYNCSPSFNWKGKLDDDEIAASRASSASSATCSSSSRSPASTRSTTRCSSSRAATASTA